MLRWQAEDDAFRARLEGELVKRHAQLYETVRPGFTWRRPLVLVPAAILVATVATASIPVGQTLRLGQVMTVDLPAGTPAPDQNHLLAHLVDARSGVEQASVSVDVDSVGAGHLLLLLFGEGLETDRLRRDLERSFPALSAGSWRVQALEADMHASLARVLGRRLFAIELDQGTVKRSRRLVLGELAERGWTGELSFDRSTGIRVIEVHAKDEAGPRD